MPESGHRGVRRRASTFPRSQIEGMEAAKTRVFLSLAFAAGGNAEEMLLSLAIAETRHVGIKIFSHLRISDLIIRNVE